jgi:hypothetical protein
VLNQRYKEGLFLSSSSSSFLFYSIILSNRERHAKTIEIAQEEVLTCIGIYLYERFHRIYQNMKSEEQTWQLLFYIGIKHLKKCFEVRD